MHARLLKIFEDPAVGLYLATNDDYTLIPRNLPEETKKIIENTLRTNLVEISAGGYDILGAFTILTDNYVLVSNIYDEQELNQLRQELDMAIYVVDSPVNVIANTILVHKNVVLLSYLYSEQLEQEMRKMLGVEVERVRLGPVDIFAQYLLPMQEKLLVSPVFSKDEAKYFKQRLGLQELRFVTVNKGSYFIKSGIVYNSRGILLGALTTPVEYESILG
ncbi:MAG: hypothetical protein GXO42_01180 [bacterium]|nr:hypothetical protein [bacterium]